MLTIVCIFLLTDILKPILVHTVNENWFMWVNKDSGKFTFPYFEALDAYWPGLLVITCSVCTCNYMYMHHLSVEFNKLINLQTTVPFNSNLACLPVQSKR